MSKKIDADFGGRFLQAAENARVAGLWSGAPNSQTAIGIYLDVSKQHVDGWMNGILPRADQLWEIADKFKCDARWLGTGKHEDMSNSVHRDKRAVLNAQKAQKILEVVLTLLDTDDEGVNEIAAAAEAVIGENGSAGKQRGRARRLR